jgi:hypothetical protein
MKTIIECANWTSESYIPEITFLMSKTNRVVRMASRVGAFKNQIKQCRGRLPVVNGIRMREWIKKL